MENTVTQFETRWNRMIVELITLADEDRVELDEREDASEDRS